jgi:hypothetical protein
MSIQPIGKNHEESGTRFPTAQCHETIGMHFVPLSEPLEMRDLQVCESAKAAAVDDPIVCLAFDCPKTVFHPPTFELGCFSD